MIDIIHNASEHREIHKETLLKYYIKGVNIAACSDVKDVAEQSSNATCCQ